MEKYQTFWRRVGASILDSLILTPVNWGVSFVFLLVGTAPVMLSWAVPGFIAVLYYILMHYYGGQTLGKMAARVKVLDDSETPVNLGQAIIRSLPQLLPVMFAVSFSTAGESSAHLIEFWASLIYGLTGLFFIADVAVCLFNEKRRALHDLIAGTVVVRTDV
jgi:uncharacterized RDD family membrane protein YckC